MWKGQIVVRVGALSVARAASPWIGMPMGARRMRHGNTKLRGAEISCGDARIASAGQTCFSHKGREPGLECVAVHGLESRATKCGFALAGLLATSCLFAPGCHSQSAQESAYEQQDKALHDPFGYTPDLKKNDMTVSGNGAFDSQGLKRDVDHVLNP